MIKTNILKIESLSQKDRRQIQKLALKFVKAIQKSRVMPGHELIALEFALEVYKNMFANEITEQMIAHLRECKEEECEACNDKLICPLSFATME